MSASSLNHGCAPKFRRGLSAAQVDQQLKAAVRRWQSAEQCVVMWFAELNQRRLFKKLGYGSIHLYASEELGFSEARSYQFLKLAERLKKLPRLEKAVTAGELGWTKARAVARVATPKTESQWLDRAKNSSRRGLEEQIDETRRRAKVLRTSSKSQLSLASSPADSTKIVSAGTITDRLSSEKPLATALHSTPNGATGGLGFVASDSDALDLHQSIKVQFDSEQFARYEALLAKLRQARHRADKAELLLSGLEALLQSGEAVSRRDRDDATHWDIGATDLEASSRKRNTTRSRTNSELATTRSASAASYQVMIQHCPICDSASVSTSRGDHEISRATLNAVLCDARIKRKGERNRSVLAPRVRRQVMERDRHRCRMPGCSGRQFLNIHHIHAREDGGSHDLENLITLCGSCHRALHELDKQQQGAALGTRRREGS